MTMTMKMSMTVEGVIKKKDNMISDMQKKFEDRKIKERERQMKIDAKRAMDQYELDLKRKEAAKRIGKYVIELCSLFFLEKK